MLSYPSWITSFIYIIQSPVLMKNSHYRIIIYGIWLETYSFKLQLAISLILSKRMSHSDSFPENGTPACLQNSAENACSVTDHINLSKCNN